MSRYLILDVGAGTLDVLYYDEESDLHYKAVVKSPVRWLAQKVADMPGDLLVTGREMGGGPLSSLLRERAKQADVTMSASAAATIHHNPERVGSFGINILPDAEAEDLKEESRYDAITIGDIDAERLKGIVDGFGVPFSFDIVGVCAQDHGVPPEGVSHLDYRHQLLREFLEKGAFPNSLLFADSQVPATLNRLSSIAQDARALPAEEIYVMDSGMAAILGASTDSLARQKDRILILDVATSHTVGAALRGNELWGFFEYHTADVTLDRLESLLRKLADGELEHRKVLEEGGHGAYIRDAFGFDALEAIIATGPKRRLLQSSQMPVRFGAPLGDNMMTGTVGVLEAIRRRKGLDPRTHI